MPSRARLTLPSIRSLVDSARPAVWPAVSVGLVPIALVAAASVVLGIEVQLMTRDVAAIGELHPLAGVLSSLGVLLWWTSATIWLFSANVFRSQGRPGDARFALGGGALSAYLALDDLFQVHEALAPTYLGIPEAVVYAALLVAFVAYFVAFWGRIVEHGALFVLLSVGMLAASASVDVVLDKYLGRLGHWNYLFEDGLKWLGICCWLVFAAMRCRAGLLARRAV